MSGLTNYGFDWGPVKVERLAHIEKRGYVISVTGPKGHAGPEVQVYVSEKGQSVKVYVLRGARAEASR